MAFGLVSSANPDHQRIVVGAAIRQTHQTANMKALITPRSYFDPEIYAEEQRKIFGRIWRFAGFFRDLENHQDYVTVEVGGKSVVVQNFEGELRAFANVCSHRFARIRHDGKGNGPLRCLYHGWIYNGEGLPYSIPSRPKFDDLSKPVLESLRLRQYAVERCGAFVFVRPTEEGPGLGEFLGGTYDVLERMSSGIGECIDVNEMLIEANWKIVVENTLESYHVGFIHPTTFKKVGASGMDFRFSGDHSAWLAPVDAGLATQMQKLRRMYEDCPFSVEGYFHQLVFPNLTIATTYGTSFSIQTFEPVAPGRTRFTSHVFQGRLADGSKRNAAVVEMLRDSVVEFNRAVFAEDKQICEQVQLGVPETDKDGILSYEEERVLRFQEAYVALMSTIEAGEGSATSADEVRCGMQCSAGD